MLGLLWDMTRGYRLRPWKSPYLLWRLETYTGRPAAEINFREFFELSWNNRRAFWQYLRWAEQSRG